MLDLRFGHPQRIRWDLKCLRLSKLMGHSSRLEIRTVACTSVSPLVLFGQVYTRVIRLSGPVLCGRPRIPTWAWPSLPGKIRLLSSMTRDLRSPTFYRHADLSIPLHDGTIELRDYLHKAEAGEPPLSVAASRFHIECLRQRPIFVGQKKPRVGKLHFPVKNKLRRITLSLLIVLHTYS